MDARRSLPRTPCIQRRSCCKNSSERLSLVEVPNAARDFEVTENARNTFASKM